MVSVDLPHRIRRSALKNSVKVLDFHAPVFVWSELFVGEHEGFTRVKTLVYFRKLGVRFSDRKDARQTEEIQGGSARFENKAMGGYKERGFTGTRISLVNINGMDLHIPQQTFLSTAIRPLLPWGAVRASGTYAGEGANQISRSFSGPSKGQRAMDVSSSHAIDKRSPIQVIAR